MANAQKRRSFSEHSAFAAAVLVCVAVITATAVWTRRVPMRSVSPTPPIPGDVAAADLLAQSLLDALTPTPSVTPAPSNTIYAPPLATMTILRPFDNTCMVPSGVTGAWLLHDAVDLSCAAGDRVLSIADGKVLSCGTSRTSGAFAEVDHGGGVVALYAGMSLLTDLRPGDPVRLGQTLGFAGGTTLEESDLPLHLHLRVTQDSTAIDPMLLFP